MSRAAMMQALDALAPFRGDGLIIVNQAIATLQAALAQPEPEPVAWRIWSPDHINVYQYTEDGGDGEPLYTHPPTIKEPLTVEPVAYSSARSLHWHPGKGISDVQLYTRPAVPLTDDEIDALYINGKQSWIGKRQIARAIEAAHRIKPISECSDGEIYSQMSALDHKPDWSAS